MITEQVPDTNEMYDDSMVTEIKQSMSRKGFTAAEHFLDWLFRQMADRGVSQMWIDHSIRVGEYAAEVAKKFLCELDIPDNDVRLIRTGGMMHDVGNILGFVGEDGDFMSVNRIINPATTRELEHLKIHPEVSRRYLELLDPDGRIGINNPYIREMVRSHHENWNGSGYPRGLKDIEIPASANLLRLADMIDTARDPDHPHKSGQAVLSVEEIRNELRNNAGKLYDLSMAVVFCMTLYDGKVVEYLGSHPSERYFEPSHVLV